MNIQRSNTETLKRYLLDDLTDDERAMVEAGFLSDDSAYDDILAVEDELFFEYKQDELSAGERETFERKFLQTSEGRDRVAFAGAFLQASAGLASQKTAAAVMAADDRPGLFRAVAAFFNFGSALQLGMAAAAVLLMLGVVGLLIQNARIRGDLASLQQQNEADRLNREAVIAEKEREARSIEEQLTAEREKNGGNEARIRELEATREKLENEIIEGRRTHDRSPDTATPGGRGLIASLIISPGHFTRGDGQPMNRVTLSPAQSNLRLGLLLNNADEYLNYTITLVSVDTGNTILTKTGLRAGGKGRAKMLSVTLPTNVLMRADYEIRLAGTTSTGQTEDITKYYFSVDK